MCKLLSYSTRSQGCGCHLSLWAGWFSFGVSSPSLWSSPSPQGSGAGFGPHSVFYFLGTQHIGWAFPYPPPGEALDGRPATPHETSSRTFLLIDLRLSIKNTTNHTSPFFTEFMLVNEGLITEIHKDLRLWIELTTSGFLLHKHTCEMHKSF